MTGKASSTPIAWLWRVLVFLRLPGCGGVALLGVVISALALVNYEPYQPGTYHALYQPRRPNTTGCIFGPVYFIVLRPEGAVVHESENEDQDAIDFAILTSPRPVYRAIPVFRYGYRGWWAPSQHTISWRIGLQAINSMSDESSESAARLSLVQHGNRAGWGAPPELANMDVVRSTFLWGGFVWNAATLFAAGVILWSLSGLPAWIRLRRARREGLCVHCLYPMAGLAPAGAKLTCLECGRAHSA